MKFRSTRYEGKHDRQRHAIRNIDMAIKLLIDNQHQIEKDIENDKQTQWTSVEHELRVARRLIVDGYTQEVDWSTWN